MKFFLLLGLLLFAFSACDLTAKKETSTEVKRKKPLKEVDDKEENEKPKVKKLKPERDRVEGNSNAEILNDIIVHESGELHISRVYLSFEDGQLVPKTNRINAGTPVYLNLRIENGWKAQDGWISLDASERITTDAGELILHAPNLFKEKPSLAAGQANHISIKATLLSTRSDIDHFVINYHVWDKNGPGEVSGSYKLYVHQPTE